MIGDWIQFKRQEKNLTPGHVAAKMGVATALIRSWENGIAQPNRQQFEALVSSFGIQNGDGMPDLPALPFIADMAAKCVVKK
jgi:transcriptional regulator with XRE-family HTH domain